MRRACFLAALTAIASMLSGRPARANDYINFGSGPMKNLYVDLVFWGNNFHTDPDPTKDDRQKVMQYVKNVASWLNGGQPSMGQEPAVHYYGVSAISPGLWLNDPDPIPSQYMLGNSAQLDDGSFQLVAARADTGQLGAAYDYNGNLASASGLPQAPNRLALVITKGTNVYCISSGRPFGCGTANGYHNALGTMLYGAVELESLQPVLSHEIMETMSDPTQSGWRASNGIFSTNELADECENQSNGTYSSITVDPPYLTSFGNVPATSCQQLIPEQHAPMAATFEYGGNGQVPLALFYVGSNGHVYEMSWGAAGQAASGPYDLGQPSATVIASGKPSAVYSLALGERVFVKGSDGALWMRANSTWTSLGGVMYGDPKAVIWGSGAVLDVFVLGTDGNIYHYGMTTGSLYGWFLLPNTGSTPFLNSPTVMSRTATTLDVFATGEDGLLKWIAYTSGGWAAPVTLSNGGNDPLLSTPAVVSQGGNAAVFANSGLGLWETSLNGSGWYSLADAPFQSNSPNNTYGYQGTPAPVSWGPGRYDLFSVSRNGKLWWWASNSASAYINTWSDVAPGTTQFQPAALVNSGVSGDPVAVSRSAGELEVLYRSGNGSLVHLTYNNGTWGAPEHLLGAVGPAVIYDPPSTGGSATQCNVGGTWMHCCPTGYAMVGANPTSNVFKCAPLDNAGAITLDATTQRNNMHSCPYGQVMVGLRGDQNLLACQALPASSIIAERVDSGTHDGYPIHTCDSGTPSSAMSGIRIDEDLLSCASTAQIE